MSMIYQQLSKSYFLKPGVLSNFKIKISKWKMTV